MTVVAFSRLRFGAKKTYVALWVVCSVVLYLNRLFIRCVAHLSALFVESAETAMFVAMYRSLILAVCITASSAAPPITPEDSNITYVKQQLVHNASDSETSIRESRVQTVPLTIPGNITGALHLDESIINHHRIGVNNTIKNIDRVISNSNDKAALNNYPDRNIFKKPAEDNFPTNGLPDPIINPTVDTDIVTSESEIVTDSYDETDHLAAESRQSDKHANSDDTTPTYEENITIDDELTTDTEVTLSDNIEIETTRSPRLLPKLSHYGKTEFGTPYNNLINGFGKRRFKSKCSCQKIWNCAKLQISVPRCPEEYFLCCA